MSFAASHNSTESTKGKLNEENPAVFQFNFPSSFDIFLASFCVLNSATCFHVSYLDFHRKGVWWRLRRVRRKKIKLDGRKFQISWTLILRIYFKWLTWHHPQAFPLNLCTVISTEPWNSREKNLRKGKLWFISQWNLSFVLLSSFVLTL